MRVSAGNPIPRDGSLRPRRRAAIIAMRRQVHRYVIFRSGLIQMGQTTRLARRIEAGRVRVKYQFCAVENLVGKYVGRG